MHYKVKEEGKVVHKALYNILGINKDGYKEVLGMYVSESEQGRRAGANFWLPVLTDLHNCGLQDILIACTDNLTGFSEAILALCGKQGSEGVYEGSEKGVSGRYKRFGRNSPSGIGRQVGEKVSCSDPVLAK